jgi:hypothetical protein
VKAERVTKRRYHKREMRNGQIVPVREHPVHYMAKVRIPKAPHRRVDERAWMRSLRGVGDNPHYIFDQMNAMKKELETRDNPDTGYLREKNRKISSWIDEIDKFRGGD